MRDVVGTAVSGAYDTAGPLSYFSSTLLLTTRCGDESAVILGLAEAQCRKDKEP